MSRCNLCNNLKKKNEDDVRLAFDFEASELRRSAEAKCPACQVILAGIQRSEDGWTLAEDVARTYVYGLANKEDSLSLEIYFRDDRPKVILEFYRREKNELLGECFYVPAQVLLRNEQSIPLLYSEEMTKYIRRLWKCQLGGDQTQVCAFWSSSITSRHEMVGK
jgi:hypothetical protein